MSNPSILIHGVKPRIMYEYPENGLSVGITFGLLDITVFFDSAPEWWHFRSGMMRDDDYYVCRENTPLLKGKEAQQFCADFYDRLLNRDCRGDRREPRPLAWQGRSMKTLKDWYTDAHADLTTQYLADNPSADEDEAEEATADAAYEEMVDRMEDCADAQHEANKEKYR